MSAKEATPQPGLRDVFTDPGYRRLWSARTVSQWGDTFNFVAIALLIYDVTGSGLGVSGGSWSPRSCRCSCLRRSLGRWWTGGPGYNEKVKRHHLPSEARAGVSVLVHGRLLRALAIEQFLAALSGGATSAQLVVLATEHLGVSGRGYGLLIGAIGIGAALGPLVLLRLIRNPARPLFVFGPYGLRGVVDLAITSVASVPFAAGALALYGSAPHTGAVTFNSMLQGETPEHVRGRVSALMNVLWQGGRLISLAVGGILPDLYSIEAVYYLGGALLLAAVAPGLASTKGDFGT